METSIHIFIIWEKARTKMDKLLEDMEKHFLIRDVYEVIWSKNNFEKNLRRFYGATLPNSTKKVESCGTGKFVVVIVEDKQPKKDWRKTSIGKQIVNTNAYDQKMTYRRWIGGEFPIHGSINQKETDHDLTLIFGRNLGDFRKILPEKWDQKIKPFKNDLVGADKWKNFEELFYVLNSTTNYLVLRNFENISEELDLDMHKDIDLLTDDKWQINYILNQQILKNSKGISRPYILINNEKISIDLRYVGDRYYDEKWSKTMLENKTLRENGIYSPNSEDYFYSLLYHILIHKSKISPDYIPKLVKIAEKINIKRLSKETFQNRKKLEDILDNFLKKNGYRYTDSFSYKIRHNEIFRLLDVAIKTSKYEGMNYLLRSVKRKIKKKIFGV